MGPRVIAIERFHWTTTTTTTTTTHEDVETSLSWNGGHEIFVGSLVLVPGQSRLTPTSTAIKSDLN